MLFVTYFNYDAHIYGPDELLLSGAQLYFSCPLVSLASPLVCIGSSSAISFYPSQAIIFKKKNFVSSILVHSFYQKSSPICHHLYLGSSEICNPSLTFLLSPNCLLDISPWLSRLHLQCSTTKVTLIAFTTQTSSSSRYLVFY